MNQHSQPKFWIGKTMSSMSIKQGCQWKFIAKQPYLYPSLYQLAYPHGEHKNQHGQICHEKDLFEYHHALGSQLSIGMKAHLMGLIRQGLSPIQIMVHYKVYIRKKALNNEPVTYDTFVLPFDVWNLVKKRANELWKNTPRIPSMLECGLWKTLIWFFIMSNMPFWT